MEKILPFIIMFLLHFSLAHQLVQINQTAAVLDIDAAQGCLYLGCENGLCVKRKFWCADPPCPFMLYCSQDKTEKRLGPTTCQSILCSPGFQCRLKYHKNKTDYVPRARCIQDVQTGVYWRFPRTFRCDPPAGCPPGLECIRTGAQCRDPPCPLVQSCIKQRGFVRFQTVCQSMNCPLGSEGCFLRSVGENCKSAPGKNHCRPHPECLQPPEIGGPLCAGQICPLGMKCSTERNCTSSRECLNTAQCIPLPKNITNEGPRPIETLDDSAVLLEMLRERLSPNSDALQLVAASTAGQKDLKKFISILEHTAFNEQSQDLNLHSDTSSSSSEHHYRNSDPWDIELAGRIYVVFELSANASWTNQSYSAAWKLRELTEPANPYRIRMKSAKSRYFLKNFLKESTDINNEEITSTCLKSWIRLNGSIDSHFDNSNEQNEFRDLLKHKCREMGMHDTHEADDERRMLFTETDPFGNTKAADCKIILETKGSEALIVDKTKKTELFEEEDEEYEEGEEEDEEEYEEDEEEEINFHASENKEKKIVFDDKSTKNENVTINEQQNNNKKKNISVNENEKRLFEQKTGANTNINEKLMKIN